MEKAEKWIFKAHGLVAKPFEYAREREGVPTCFQKRERERVQLHNMCFWGPLGLALLSLCQQCQFRNLLKFFVYVTYLVNT